MAEEVGVGYVRLVPSMRGFQRAAERQLKRSLSGPSRKAGEDAGDEVGDGVERRLRDRMGRAGVKIMRGFGRALRASVKPVAATVGVAFAAQLLGSLTAALASGVAKVAHGLGAVAALLPAAAVAGIAAFGALKIAVSGVGDALSAGLTGDVEAFDEALEGLSPAARSFAREVVGLRGQLDALKGSVQQSFFGPLQDEIRPLADALLPSVQRTLSSIAASFGVAASSAIGFLTLPSSVEAVDGSLVNVQRTVGNLATGLDGLLRAFLPLVTVGSSMLPGLTMGFGGATDQLARFMTQAERTGQLREWIQGGLDALRSLWDTVKQLGRIFTDLGAIGSMVWAEIGVESGSVLDTIERLAGQVRRFFESAEGSSALSETLGIIGSVVSNLRDNITDVASMLGDVFGPIMPQVGDFITSLSDLKSAVLDTGLEALEPVLEGIANILGSVLLPALTGLADWLADNKPVLQGIGIAILAFLVPAFVSWAISAGAAAIATLLAMAPLILIGVAIAALAALVIIHFDTIKSAIETAFNWVVDNWQLLLTILTGPFGAAVWIITSHWDKIKAAGLAVFNWIKDNWDKLLAIITGPFGAAVWIITSNWQTIKDGAMAAKNWVTDRFDDLVSAVTGLPGRIQSAASGMWNGIKDSFRNAINGIIGLWNGLSFPSVTVGGGDPLGVFGPSLPTATIGGWELPNIPTLHSGGIFEASGARDEGLALLQDGEGVFSSRAMAALASGGGAVGPAAVRVVLDVTGGPPEMVRMVQKWVRTEGGGDVQSLAGAR